MLLLYYLWIAKNEKNLAIYSQRTYSEFCSFQIAPRLRIQIPKHFMKIGRLFTPKLNVLSRNDMGIFFVPIHLCLTLPSYLSTLRSLITLINVQCTLINFLKKSSRPCTLLLKTCKLFQHH